MSNLEDFSKLDNVESKISGSSTDLKFEKPDGFENKKNYQLENIKETDTPENWQSGSPLDGANGMWDGERGNSEWIPDPEIIPANPHFNPDHLSNAEIFKDFPQKGITFENGEANFEPFAEATVKIDNFTGDRYGKGGNFDQATEKFADQKGLSVREAKDYMTENHLTFHERNDCQTMDLVPKDIHGTVRHTGGVSIYKQQHGLEG